MGFLGLWVPEVSMIYFMTHPPNHLYKDLTCEPP